MPASIHASLPPDPLLLARTLAAAGEPFALLHASERSADPLARFSFVAALPDRASGRLDPLADDPDAGDMDPDALSPSARRDAWNGDSNVARRAPRWIGVLPYEARRELERPGWTPRDARPRASLERAEWRRYRAALAIDHLRGEVFATGLTRADAQEILARVSRAGGPGAAVSPSAPSIEIADAEPLERHADRIRAAKELIFRGDLYQVNLARRIRVALRRGHLTDVYARLSRAAPTPLGALLFGFGDGVTVLSTSPELFLLAEAGPAPGSFGRLLTAPIKGTRPRGPDAAADESLARELDADPKERAELTMIIDVERNDLGRVAEVGSVRQIRAPHVVSHRTVHHRVALLAARARADLARADVIAAMLPSGSVTGAPKVRAMEVIASLEPRRRGLYTGAFGSVSHDGRLTLAMAIRTLVMSGDEGEYWTGGGIVADSDPDREVEETRWKALQLERAASGP